jgi:hypothetical protein
MLTLRHHNSQDYARLPDIDSSDAGIISLGDQACLDEIGSCLLRAKANTRFGATLLHSHFKISDDELLLEEVLVDEHLITLRPIRNHSSTIFATNVCVDDINTSNGELRSIGRHQNNELECSELAHGSLIAVGRPGGAGGKELP